MVRGSRKFGVAFTLVALFQWAVHPAWAMRAVPWAPGRTVVVKLKVAQTTEIIFPADVVQFSNPEEELFSIRFSEARLYVKPTVSFSPTRLFVADSLGRNYVVQLQEAPEGESEDDSVEISPEVFEKSAERPVKGPNPEVLRLFKALHLERPLPGYKITDAQSEPFYAEPTVVRMRLLKIYEGPVYAGLLIEIENLSSETIRVNPQQFKINGFVAGCVLDMLLAPREPEDTVQAFKGQPKKTRGYVVGFASEFKKRVGGKK